MKKSIKSFTESSRIFVDTSGYFSLLVKSDERHAAANRLFEDEVEKRTRFITTDYVLDETVTLLVARGNGRLVEVFFDSVFTSRACTVEWMDPERFRLVREFMRRHQDKAWSFTDCFSFQVMREIKLRRALTSDHHFRQAGFTPLLV